jgi:hypothetical protein
VDAASTLPAIRSRQGHEMKEQSRDEPRDAPLNPALKSGTETIYPTTESSPAPIDTTSASENEGEGWPVIWLLVTIAGVALAVFFLV